MKSNLFSIITCILLFTVGLTAQAIKKQRLQKRAGFTQSKTSAQFPGYNFLITINGDGSKNLQVVTGYELMDLNNARLKKALSEYVSMQNPQPGRKPVGPNVYIHPDAALDFKTIVDVIESVRVSDSAEVTVDLPDGPPLKIPKVTNPIDYFKVKPNPLTLVAALDENGNVTLNNEEDGTLADLSKLTDRLRDIFRRREDNGVFRKGTNEVEKTVFVKVSLSAKFADLIKLAKAVQNAGSDSIGLQVDDLVPAVNSRKSLITIDK